MSQERNSKNTVVKGPTTESKEPGYAWPKHPWTPGPLISVPDKVIKSSIGGMVRPIPRFENGRAFLELRNGTDARIEVRHLLLLIPCGPSSLGIQMSNGVRLLNGTVELGPLKSRQVDVTDHLKKTIKDGFGSESGTFHFRIHMHLEPELPSQLPPGAYKVRLADGRCEYFGPDRGE